MKRRLARSLVQHAARILHPVQPTQATAMLAELDYVTDEDASEWALGCLVASYRQRASALAIGLVIAQLCVALPAAVFGFLHAYVGFDNLRAKIMLLAGALPPPAPESFLYAIHARPLEHWLTISVVFAIGGALHVLAATMMAIGNNRKVLPLAIVVVALDLVAPMAVASHSVAPVATAIYIGLITLMAIAAAAFAWLWRWEERRSAAGANR